MKRKIIVSLLVLLILCGCDVKYNVIINENLSIDESAIATENESFFSENLSKDEGIKLIYSPYEAAVKNANYYVIDYRKNENSGKYLSQNFANINSFVNNSIFYKRYWPVLNYVEKNNLITIQTTGNFILSGEYSYENPYIDNCEIIFTVPYKVTDSTADSCKISDNKYVCQWNIDGKAQDKSFSLTFDKGIKVSDMPNANNNGTYDPTPNNNNNTFLNILIIVGLILLIVGLIAIIMLIVHYKEKKDLEKQERGH